MINNKVKSLKLPSQHTKADHKLTSQHTKADHKPPRLSLCQITDCFIGHIYDGFLNTSGQCFKVFPTHNSLCSSRLTRLHTKRYGNLYTDLDRPLALQEVEAPRVSTQSAREGGKVVSRRHRPLLAPTRYLSYSPGP
jgi:hypothetical protein